MNNKELERLKKELSLEIEELRQRSDQIVANQGLDNVEIVRLSKQLDQLISQYLNLE